MGFRSFLALSAREGRPLFFGGAFGWAVAPGPPPSPLAGRGRMRTGDATVIERFDARTAPEAGAGCSIGLGVASLRLPVEARFTTGD